MLRFLVLAMGLMTHVLVVAQICPATQVVNPVINGTLYTTVGIGDGCTTKYSFRGVTFNADWIANIYVYKGRFTPACDAHDKCYTTLGRNGHECDTAMLASMRSSCGADLVCLTTAEQYYGAIC